MTDLNLPLIDEIHDQDLAKIDEAVLKKYLEKGQPVVFRGLVKHWKYVEKSSESVQALADYVSSFASNELYGAMILDSKYRGRIQYKDDFSGMNFEGIKETFVEILQRILKNRREDPLASVYMGSISLESFDQDLIAQNSFPVLDSLTTPRLWMGNKTVVGGHYDVPQNFACNVAGRRRFTLFPAHCVNDLYIGPFEMTPAGRTMSLVDIANPDYSRFPGFRRALRQALYTELEPGDVLYLPSMWWHFVESLDDFNMLINYWWNDTDVDVELAHASLMFSLLGLHKLPLAQRKAVKSLFDYYVFREHDEPTAHIPDHAHGVLGEERSLGTTNYIKNIVRRALKKNYVD